MGATSVTSKESLASVASNLKTDNTNINEVFEKIKSQLSNIQNCDDIDLSSAAYKLSSNTDAIKEDISNVITNINNYSDKLSAFDVNDFNSGGQLMQLSATQDSGTVISLPDGLGSIHTYMGWQCITSKSSNQYKLREAAGMNFDSEGFAKIGDRYVVATTTTFGNVGDYIDVKQADGTVIKCIIGDIKSQNDAGCNKWGHNDGKCVVEFVVDKDSWYNSNHANPGTSSCHPEWNQNIVSITNTGNYWGNPTTVKSNTGNSGNNTSNSNSSSKVTYTISNSGTAAAAASTITYSVGSSHSNSSPSSSSSSGYSPINATKVTISSGDPNIDVSKYHNCIEKGFEVTVGNKSYDLSDKDIEILMAIVSAESDKTYDDALAVITTILNRCEAPNWVNSHGTDPVAQATAPNQFVVYQKGSYASYMGGRAPDTVKQAVLDALAGVRNHKYLSFRSNGTTSFSNNMISSTGNRYANPMTSSIYDTVKV